MSEPVVSEKESFFSGKHKLIFLGILVLGLVVRLKYFTINQALWWDEADWLSIAKHWAFGVPFDVSSLRPPLFPALAALLFKVGFGEFSLRILMLIISVLGIYLTYLVAREIFDRRLALVASFMMAFSYVSIFYTARVMIDLLMMVLWLSAVWFFWAGYVKKGPSYNLWLMGVVIGLGASLKLPFVLVGLPFLLYVFLRDGFSMFSNKALWLSVVFFFLALAPFAIYFNHSYGGLPFISTSSYGFAEGEPRFGEYFKVFANVLQSPVPFLASASPIVFNIFFVAFLAGLGYMLVKIFLGFDLVRKESSLRNYAFLLAWIVVPYVFFSLIEWVEDRYLLMVFPAVFMVSALIVLKCFDFLKKHNSYLALFFILLILFDFTYYQLSYADSLIKGKAYSYAEFKYAGLWIKDRTDKGDLIFNSGIPQNTYYSERKTLGYPDDVKEFESMISSYKPKFMVLSLLERSPEWSYSWPEEHKDLVVPAQAYYADNERKKPLVIIYEFVYNSTSPS